MTNAEKYKEVFGFELNTKTDYYCPFNSTKCDNLPCDACIETFWQSEYQEPNVQAERQKWIKAIEDIKAEINGESNYILSGDKQVKFTSLERLWQIIDKHTKELMK